MNRIIFALDTTNLDKAIDIAQKIKNKIFTIKLGLEFFNAHGKEGVKKFNEIGITNLMLDLKLKDIPETVYKAIKALDNIQFGFLTIHGQGGKSMIDKAKKAADEIKSRPKIMMVTILTALNDEDLKAMGNNSTVVQQVEKLAKIDTIIFDKTGTITASNKNTITYEGEVLNADEEILLKNTLRGSNHPLSRQLYQLLKANNIISLDEFKETTGKGLEARVNNQNIKVGSASFVNKNTAKEVLKTSVHISTNNKYKGRYVFYNQYRKGISKLFNKLNKKYELVILSGDNASEKENL